MRHKKIKQKYAAMGLEVEEGFVEGGFEYPKHHHGTTCLLVTDGSLVMQRDRDEEMITYGPGEEFVVSDGEFHWGKAGPKGYSFIAGWNEQEYQKYPEDQHY